MTALELLTTLRELGVTLTLGVDRLHVDAPQGALTSALRVAIREHKAKLLDLLVVRSAITPPVWWWESVVFLWVTVARAVQ